MPASVIVVLVEAGAMHARVRRALVGRHVAVTALEPGLAAAGGGDRGDADDNEHIEKQEKKSNNKNNRETQRIKKLLAVKV